MANIPGREGAVTGGTFDQSNRWLLPLLFIAGGDASDVVGATVVLPAGAGSAAEDWSTTPNTPASPNFTNDSSVRCISLEKLFGLTAGVNEEDGQSGRRMAGFGGLSDKNARNYSKVSVYFELMSILFHSC